MKLRFNTYDIVCNVTELQRLIGLRVNQIYDIDNRTYLIRFQDKDKKTVLLLESGHRFHTTEFEWPKNDAPSGFSMKLRKHLKNKRLEHFVQLEMDRIVDLQFGTNEAAYHVILELYDRGNIILTDHEMTILNILRPHVEGEVVRFAVREKYPESRAKESDRITEEKLNEILKNGRPGDSLKKVLNPHLPYGPSIIDHILTKHNLSTIKLAEMEKIEEVPVVAVVEQPVVEKLSGKKQKKQQPLKPQKQKQDSTTRILNFERDIPVLLAALADAELIMEEAKKNKPKGYIIQRKELRPPQKEGDAEEYFIHNEEYHPMLFAQHFNHLYKEFDSFDAAVDEFYSTSESQKIDVKTLQQERDALKKLSNVKKDHEKRLDDLEKWQVYDKNKADLITRNQQLVDSAILAIRSAIASQLPWPEIHNLWKTAQGKGDAVASAIKQLKLEKNHISLMLTDPYIIDGDDDDDEKLESTLIDIDLGLSAYANATRYYDQKRTAAKKQQRTIESSTKALKSAERKTQQSLKEMRNISKISKARKVYWFEKFYWFISTENYLIIGGRDQQQNEQIVKRYMRPNDIYVHAEIQGASSVVIRNPTDGDIPPKTLLEAGTMAISYSVAWDAKVVTNAYWVKSNQVSKTAPTGEYLGTGSFMIRGKKNFLPPCHLILGMSFLFKLEESSVSRHIGERKVRSFDDDVDSRLTSLTIDEDIKLLSSDEDEELSSSAVKEKSTPNADDDKIVAEKDDEHHTSDDENNFPDTHVKIVHTTGQIVVQTDPILARLTSNTDRGVVDNDEVFLGDDQPYVIHTGIQPKLKQQKKDRAARKGKSTVVNQNQKEAVTGPEKKSDPNQPKRGQKGKLKKIREKYKDQDEDEKRIRMEILKSAGTGKVGIENNVKTNQNSSVEVPAVNQEVEKKIFSKIIKEPVIADDETGGVDDEAVDTFGGGGDQEILDSLTGCPVDEDEILFAIPVITPYQSIHNYKYKVKITPGTGRRGKAAKTALQIFMRDRTCTAREKDLLKGVKDETIARNMPGKVKLSAPHLHKYK